MENSKKSDISENSLEKGWMWKRKMWEMTITKVSPLSFQEALPVERLLAPALPLPQSHRDHSTMDTTRVFSATYSLNETVQMINVSYQGAPTVRLVKHVIFYWEPLQIEALLLWLSVSTKLTWMTWQPVQNIVNTSEKEMPVWVLIKKTPAVIIPELVLLTGLTKLPVGDCHPKCRCSPFCLGLQLQRAVPFSVWAGVPQGSMFGPWVK